MAQLKDSVVQGSLRVTDKIFTNNLVATGDITAHTFTVEANDNEARAHLIFTRSNYNYIKIPSDGKIGFLFSDTVAANQCSLAASSTAVYPGASGSISLGTVDNKWKDIYVGSIFNNDAIYISTTTQNSIIFQIKSASKCRVDTDGHFRPETNNGVNLGITSVRWKTGYFVTSVEVGTANKAITATDAAGAQIAPTVITQNSIATGGGFLLTQKGTFAARLAVTTLGTTSAGGVTTLTLGNSSNSTTNYNSQGKIVLYSANTAAHTIDTTSTTTAYTHTLPNATGTIAHTNSNITGTAANVTGIVAIANGGTGADSASDARANLLAAAGNGRIFYGTCATAAATAAKVVICAQYDGLHAGDVMIVTFSSTNTTNTALTMSIHDKASSPTKTTDAKSIKCQIAASIANIPAVGYLVAARPYMFVYDGTYWVLMNVNRDNNDNSVDRLYAAAGDGREVETAANGGIGLHRYSLEMMTANYKWSSIASKDSTAIANTADSNKVAATAAFLINSPILYQSTDKQAAAGGTKINVDGYTAIPLNLSYSTGTSSNAAGGLTLQRPVYLVGTINDAKTFKLDTTKWWTQTLPASEDGKIYIYLGIAYSATNIYLSPWHPIYQYKGSSICEYNGRGISSVTRSGTTFTVTRDDSTTFTFTQQDNNTLLRTYASSTNLEVPLIGQNSAASATATWTSYTSGSKDWYGAIPATDANRIKINLSNGNIKIGATTDASSTTGALYVAGGISVQKKLYVKTDATVAGATTLNGKLVGSSNNYGATLPSSGQTTGQIFFQTCDTSGFVKNTGDTMTGRLKIAHSTYGSCVELWSDVEGGNIFLHLPSSGGNTSNTGYEIDTCGGNLRIYRTVDNGVNGTHVIQPLCSDGTSHFLKLYGAVWNDYAEFRRDNIQEKDRQKPGNCVYELGDGTLALTTKRLQYGCEIISDTYGFAIGQNNECNTPIASNGRVLAYPFENIEVFRKHIGRPVCSGPNGTVSIMTEEEEQKHPSCIVGTISEIPSYKRWGTGNVEVNGRVWIRVR